MTSRFTVAIHILSLLALTKGESRTSEELATSVNTNPVVIRKILGILRKAGLIQIQMGQWEMYLRKKYTTHFNGSFFRDRTSFSERTRT